MKYSNDIQDKNLTTFLNDFLDQIIQKSPNKKSSRSLPIQSTEQRRGTDIISLAKKIQICLLPGDYISPKSYFILHNNIKFN